MSVLRQLGMHAQSDVMLPLLLLHAQVLLVLLL